MGSQQWLPNSPQADAGPAAYTNSKPQRWCIRFSPAAAPQKHSAGTSTTRILSLQTPQAHSSGCQIRLRLMPDLQHTPIQSHRDGALGSHLQQLRRSTLQGPVLPEYSPSRHHEHTTMAANRERSTWKWREDASDKSAGCHG